MYVIIVGCGRVGAELARRLAGEGHNVVSSQNNSAFARLERLTALTFPETFNQALLKQAGIEKADAFCSVTNGDNTNLIAAQVAKRIFNVPKVLARIYDPQRAHIYTALGMDIISGTVLFAAMLRDKIIESRFSSYLIETKELGVLELEAKNGLAGKTIKEINIPGEFMVVALRNLEGVVIPEPSLVLNETDTLTGVVKVASLKSIKEKFGL